MPGNPQAKLKRVANLCEWFSELATDFDRLLPACYRFNGEPSTGDQRADAWANADRCIITTASALNELEGVLRRQSMLRSKPRGENKPQVEAEVVEVNVSGDG